MLDCYILLYLVLQVILCAVWGAGKLGLAYYIVDMAYLFVMPDVAESEDFGMLKRGKLSNFLNN